MNAHIDIREDDCFDPFAAASPLAGGTEGAAEWCRSACLSDPGDDPLYDPDPPPEM